MHYRHWVRRNRGKNLKYGHILGIGAVKVNLYVKWMLLEQKQLPGNDIATWPSTSVDET